MKVFWKHKNSIIAAMDGETPSKNLLEEAKKEFATQNPPDVRRKRLILRVAYATAPVLVVGIITTLMFTVILPRYATGFGKESTRDSADVNESVGGNSNFSENYSSKSEGSVLLQDFMVSYQSNPYKKPEDFEKNCLKLTSEVGGYEFYYEETEENTWYAVAKISDGVYMVVDKDGCTQTEFESHLKTM